MTLRIVPLLVLAGSLPIGGAANAQHAGSLDRSRALISDSTVFQPFLVEETRPLAEARRDRTVHDATPLLVLEIGGRWLALSMEQLAYHHAAQGELAGEPWMVSF